MENDTRLFDEIICYSNCLNRNTTEREEKKIGLARIILNFLVDITHIRYDQINWMLCCHLPIWDMISSCDRYSEGDKFMLFSIFFR